jgi:NADH-quinone oxidoreductase subunit E
MSLLTEELKVSIFSEALTQKMENLKTHYPEGKEKSALLPALHMAQAEYGWLSAETMEAVATILGIKAIEVFEVATFYTMFHLKPVGKYVLEVCRTSPCCLNGAEELIAHLQTKLGIQIGDTSSDGLFTLKTVECLAACGMAPVLQIGPEYTYHENLNEVKVDALLENLRLQKN